MVCSSCPNRCERKYNVPCFFQLESALNEPVAVTAIVLIIQGLVETGVIGAEALHTIQDRLRIEGVRLSESGHPVDGGDLMSLANRLDA